MCSLSYDPLYLLKVLNDFEQFLRRIRAPIQVPLPAYAILEASTWDGVMKVDESRSIALFNPNLLVQGCSLDYYLSTIVHEAYHFLVHGVPNKDDVRRFKLRFDDKFMVLADIEADTAAAHFFKDVMGYSLVQHLDLLYQGTIIFGDDTVHQDKVERFLGSILSISDLHCNPKAPRLFLPSIGGHLDTATNVLILQDGRMIYVRRELPPDLIRALRHIYVDRKKHVTRRGCIEKMLELVKEMAFTALPVDVMHEAENVG